MYVFWKFILQYTFWTSLQQTPLFLLENKIDPNRKRFEKGTFFSFYFITSVKHVNLLYFIFRLYTKTVFLNCLNICSQTLSVWHYYWWWNISSRIKKTVEPAWREMDTVNLSLLYIHHWFYGSNDYYGLWDSWRDGQWW